MLVWEVDLGSQCQVCGEQYYNSEKYYMNDIVSMIFNIDKTRNCRRRGGDGYSRYANQKNDDATSITKVVKDANQISNFRYAVINCSKLAYPLLIHLQISLHHIQGKFESNASWDSGIDELQGTRTIFNCEKPSSLVSQALVLYSYQGQG